MEPINIIFKDFFKTEPELCVASPGRINLIGEHTDYNNGFVLPAAIDKHIEIAIGKRNDSKILLFSQDFNEDEALEISDIQPLTHKHWPNYILGVVHQLQKKNINVPGFNLALQGNIPIGGGLSSSAAVECAVVFALNELLNIDLSKKEMVLIAQKAEHEFAGVKCGIMDQFSSMLGKKDHVIRLDCRSLEYEYFPLDLQNYQIVLFDTQVKHTLASSEYNIRRAECEKAVELIQKAYPEVKSLRDATIPQVEECVKNVDEKAYKRAKYMVEEIARLLAATQDLEEGNLKAFGEKMYETHEGLSQLYEVSCNELDILVDLVKNNESVIGARMMGGGFGGCTINLIAEDKIDEIISKVDQLYTKKTGLKMKVYRVNIQDGTHLI